MTSSSRGMRVAYVFVPSSCTSTFDRRTFSQANQHVKPPFYSNTLTCIARIAYRSFAYNNLETKHALSENSENTVDFAPPPNFFSLGGAL